MESSFYGGKQGYSFVLAKSFKTVAEMVQNFRKGPEYKEVRYEDYVLINTENKNNPENGEVYRRGREYTNELGGAIYIGTIVGPGGPAPMVEMDTIEGVKNKQAQEGYHERFSEGEYNVPNLSIVPGKVGNTYNDSIKWACCSIATPNYERTVAYIGFSFPYTVIDYTAESVDPYYNRNNNTDNFINQNLITREDDGAHPFFELWKMRVPKGIKGDSFKNFRVIPAADIVQDYEGKADDVAHNRQILVYDYYHHDREAGGEPVSLFLGDFNIISNIALDEDGTVTIDYTHDDTDVYPNLFKWIKTVSLNKDNGHFRIEYNYDEKNGQPTLYETDLSWVNGIEILEDGKVNISYSTGEVEQLGTALKWIKNVELFEDGTVKVIYNNDTNDTFSKEIQWIDNLTLAQNGTFTVEYNNGAPDYQTNITWPTSADLQDNGEFTIEYNNNTPDFKAYLKWPTDASLTDNGIFTITFNNGDPDFITNLKWPVSATLGQDGLFTINFNNGDEPYTTNLKWPTEASLQDNGDFKIEYNNGDEPYMTNLKWPVSATLAANGLFTINFNNGDEPYTTNLRWPTDVSLGDNGDFQINFNDGENPYTTNLTWPTTATLTPEGVFTIQYNNDTPDYVVNLKWTTDIRVAEDGTVTIVYNDGTSTVYDKYLKIITNITVDTSGENNVIGTGDQKIHIEYNTGETAIIGEPLNYILETVITNDFHYLVRYSDPALRQEIKDNNLSYVYDGKDDWHDLGSIKDESGVLIGLNIPLEDNPNLIEKANAIAYLNVLYPEGLSHSLKGNVVTIGNQEETKEFYAFDYSINQEFDTRIVNEYLDTFGVYTIVEVDGDYGRLKSGAGWLYLLSPQIIIKGDLSSVSVSGGSVPVYNQSYNYEVSKYKGWYYLGNFSEVDPYSVFIVGKVDEEGINIKKDSLKVNGLWFVMED